MEMTAWLLFLPQLPASPSSLRVLVWRRLRTAGALGLQHGVWVLPVAARHEQFFGDLLAEVRAQGGGGTIFVAQSLDPALPTEIVARFQAERAQDYAEFQGRCRDFLDEIARETATGNLTFAELEENEQDLQKLVGWLERIATRDFFGGEQAERARRALATCHQRFGAFARAVYREAGLAPTDEPNTDGSS